MFDQFSIRAEQLRQPRADGLRFRSIDSGEHKRRFLARRPSAEVRGGSGDLNAPLRRSAKMARLEAVLFIADGAHPIRRLVQLATLSDVSEARRLIDGLNEAYERSRCAFRIERVATGYQLLTRPQFAFWLDKLHQRQSALKLSPPAMETLSIVAYQQPMTRADIESIRGVQASEMLKLLMERGLVRIAGEDDSLGRPFLYETTRKFLELFGLQSLDDLPMADRLRRKREKPTPADVPPDDDELLESAA